MARYVASFRTVDGTTGTPSVEIRATSSDRPRIMELAMFSVGNATTTLVGLGVPALIGVNPTTYYRVQAEDGADPLGTTLVATAWATAPTIPANFNRRLGFRALTGCPLIVSFPRGFIIAPSSSAVLWNLQANQLLDVSVTVDE